MKRIARTSRAVLCGAAVLVSVATAASPAQANPDDYGQLTTYGNEAAAIRTRTGCDMGGHQASVGVAVMLNSNRFPEGRAWIRGGSLARLVDPQGNPQTGWFHWDAARRQWIGSNTAPLGHWHHLEHTRSSMSGIGWSGEVWQPIQMSGVFPTAAGYHYQVWSAVQVWNSSAGYAETVTAWSSYATFPPGGGPVVHTSTCYG